MLVSGGDYIDTDFNSYAVPDVEINARVLSGVRRVRVTSERKLKPNEEYGAFPQSDREGGECFSVYIERVLTSPERADYFSLSDFLLSVKSKNKTYAYMYCSLLKTEEEYDAENGGTQKMMITSRKRAVIQEVDVNGNDR